MSSPNVYGTILYAIRAPTRECGVARPRARDPPRDCRLRGRDARARRLTWQLARPRASGDIGGTFQISTLFQSIAYSIRPGTVDPTRERASDVRSGFESGERVRDETRRDRACDRVDTRAREHSRRSSYSRVHPSFRFFTTPDLTPQTRPIR